MAPSAMTTWWLPHLDSCSVADVAQDAAPTNQLKSLSIISTSGHVLGPGLGIRPAFLCAGMEGSSYTVSCPRSGPAVCGHCIGRERHRASCLCR